MKPSKDEQHATVAEAEREALAVNVAALQRDAERWRWAKGHSRMAVYIFDLGWMEQRDLDGVIDAAIQLASGLRNRERDMIAVIPPTNCRLKCTACGDQPLQVKQDQCG